MRLSSRDNPVERSEEPQVVWSNFEFCALISMSKSLTGTLGVFDFTVSCGIDERLTDFVGYFGTTWHEINFIHHC